MFHPKNKSQNATRNSQLLTRTTLSKRFTGITLGVAATLGVELGRPLMKTVLMPQAAIAHQVETSGDVGGTIHIEPNDSPRAGEEYLVWFALTKRGGQSIPLSTCDCTLEIYTQPYREEDEAIAIPDLRAISAERYSNIPGADVTFPRAGAYDLVLTGNPVNSGTFSPFELTFSVTVTR